LKLALWLRARPARNSAAKSLRHSRFMLRAKPMARLGIAALATTESLSMAHRVVGRGAVAVASCSRRTAEIMA